MKFLSKAKDGGPESTVTGYWLVEAKKLFSVALLKFEDGSRDAYHSHAFDSLNWVLSGQVDEQQLNGIHTRYRAGWIPVVTRRNTFHKVVSRGTTWVLTIRGPWVDFWKEWTRDRGYETLTHGRKTV